MPCGRRISSAQFVSALQHQCCVTMESGARRADCTASSGLLSNTGHRPGHPSRAETADLYRTYIDLFSNVQSLHGYNGSMPTNENLLSSIKNLFLKLAFRWHLLLPSPGWLCDTKPGSVTKWMTTRTVTISLQAPLPLQQQQQQFCVVAGGGGVEPRLSPLCPPGLQLNHQ